MGVCRFFQTGSCRYGTKCHNEHFDIKEYLKADVESAFNGKMWPFSVYGPFKDKTNFPNFIEDQSFEEVRLMCYDAKRNNQFDQFHVQFNREVMEATNKMKSLLQTTPQIIDVMIKIYNAPDGAAPPVATNSFGSTGLTNQTTSIFSKPTLTAGNIFGGNTSVGVGGATTNSIFGGATQNQNANSIFGGAAAATQNMFGQQPQQQQQQQLQQQQASIFGNQQAPTTNIFGQQPQVQAQAQPSIFAQTVQQQQPNPFTQPNTGGENIFANAQQANPFAQANAGGQNAFGFGQQNHFANQTQPAFTGFQQQQQQPTQQQQPQMPGFGVPQAQQPPSGFFSQASAGYAPQQHAMQQPIQAQSGLGMYSQLKDLTAEQLEAFKAEFFAQGMVPFDPPPREFC
ncbi:uncharacterized protein Dwil_GK15175 [Drosophila willistoni]|uniref:Nucleoporin NUP42 n=2 Tax=Drosophila willistoni TaxID=7260 RepID=B4MW09_DROWI|nr:uncharacterized protein Dwil_GK15175 [Drosophila willistoni]